MQNVQRPKWAVLLLVCIICSAALAAQSSSTVPGPQSATAPPAAKPATVGSLSQQTATPPRSESEPSHVDPNSDLRLELALLKQQNAILKGSQADLLATVYWALGTVVLLALALTGYSWFANFKVYERDKNALTADLNASLVSAESRMQSRIDATSSTLRDELRNNFANSSSELESKLTASNSDLESKLALARSSLGEELARLEYDLSDFEADYRIDAGMPSVAVGVALNQLRVAIRLKSAWRSKWAMEALEKATDKGGEYMEREITESLKLLEKVPTLENVSPEVLQKAFELMGKVRGAKIWKKKDE
ncbi:MAG: hypothetical protein WCA19_14845 [Candidatus Acidiferrales bacterium]